MLSNRIFALGGAIAVFGYASYTASAPDEAVIPVAVERSPIKAAPPPGPGRVNPVKYEGSVNGLPVCYNLPGVRDHNQPYLFALENQPLESPDIIGEPTPTCSHEAFERFGIAKQMKGYKFRDRESMLALFASIPRTTPLYSPGMDMSETKQIGKLRPTE